MNNRTQDRAACGALVRFALLGGILVLPLAGCGSDLLKVTDPDIVTPSSLSGDIGLKTLYAGAVGDFELAYQGGTGNGSFPDNVVTAASLMSDETILSGTFPTRTEFDQRSIDVKNGTLSGMFFRLQRARASTENAAAAIADAAGAAGDSRVGRLRGLEGFAYLGFAENYCDGVPFSTADASGNLTYGEQQSNADILTAAVTLFDNAAAAAAGDADVNNLALVGKARALLDLGQYANAAAAASQVPTDFVYNLEPSINSSTLGFSLENGFYSANTAQRRLSVADAQGGNGLDFRTAGDPRVPVEENPQGGFDSTSKQYNLITFAQNGETLGREAKFPLASGIEARLIEAEARLQASDAAGMLSILNDLRATMAGLDPLTDPGTQAARVDMLFRERAFWLYGTGHRLSDLRRLVRQYNRDAESVFPSGTYEKGGSYGSDVNYPIPFNELNNPNLPTNGETCTDRSA